MRRLPRPIAIALPIAVAALWIHSQFFHLDWHWAPEVGDVSRDDTGRCWGTQLTSGNGRITLELHFLPRTFVRFTERGQRLSSADGWALHLGYSWMYVHRATDEGWSFLGFGHGHVSYQASFMSSAPKGPVSVRWFYLPYWALFLLACLPLVRRLLRARRQAKLAGCCTKCGYDLRATPNRCPECGTTVPRDAPAPPA